MNIYKVEKDYNKQTAWDLDMELYVDERGHVYSLKKSGLKEKAQQSRGMYLAVNIKGTDGKYHNVGVHHLIYCAINHVQLLKGDSVHHINGNKEDNSIKNLRLESLSKNTKDFFLSGIHGENRKYAINQEYLIDSEILKKYEIWKFNEKYQLTVSSRGRVKRGDHLLIISKANGKNNLIVATYINKKTSSVSLMRLVADTFLKIEFDNYKTLLKEQEKGITALNLFTVPSKKGKKATKKVLVKETTTKANKALRKLKESEMTISLP